MTLGVCSKGPAMEQLRAAAVEAVRLPLSELNQ